MDFRRKVAPWIFAVGACVGIWRVQRTAEAAQREARAATERAADLRKLVDILSGEAARCHDRIEAVERRVPAR